MNPTRYASLRARPCFDRLSTGLAVGKIQVFDAQAQALDQPEAGTVEQPGDELVRAGEGSSEVRAGGN
jgi:hypothetical protein